MDAFHFVFSMIGFWFWSIRVHSVSRESSPEKGEDGAEPLSRESTPETDEDEVEPTIVGDDHGKGNKHLIYRVIFWNLWLSLTWRGITCSAGKVNDLSTVNEIDTSYSVASVVATGRRCVSCMCLWLWLVNCGAR